uniref:Uncharacterized protein n=1 Tax=Glossina pallidipes TaxID=7398 RepID=A0A1B0AD79_GLOPL
MNNCSHIAEPQSGQYLFHKTAVGAVWSKPLVRVDTHITEIPYRTMKCHFLQDKIEYLGHIITADGIVPGVKAEFNKELLSFSGLYYLSYLVLNNTHGMRMDWGLSGPRRRLKTNRPSSLQYVFRCGHNISSLLLNLNDMIRDNVYKRFLISVSAFLHLLLAVKGLALSSIAESDIKLISNIGQPFTDQGPQRDKD